MLDFVRCSRNDTLEHRLSELHQGIVEILAEHKPECMAIEEVYSHYDRPTTAILMGHARGVILLAAAQADCRCIPTQQPRSRNTYQQWPRIEKPDAVCCKAPTESANDTRTSDVADALAIAICHYHSSQGPARLLGRNAI